MFHLSNKLPNKHFIILSITMLFTATFARITKLSLYPLDNTYIIYSSLIISYTSFFIWFKHLPKNNPLKNIILNLSEILFLTIIITTTLFKITTTTEHLPSDLFIILIATAILTASILFNVHKNKFEKTDLQRKECTNHSLLNNWQYLAVGMITIIFISIKIGTPLIYTGSYIDEYNHILSGISFFKTGHFAEIFQDQLYSRAPYVSLSIGAILTLFKTSIFVSKLVPATIGLINFSLLYFLIKKITPNKTHQLLALTIYTINPWIIFMHFYIRIYSYYEMSVLILLSLFINLHKHLQAKKYKKALFTFTIISFINIFLFLFSHDFGNYLVIFLSLANFLYIYIVFENQEKYRAKKIIILFVLFLFAATFLFRAGILTNIFSHNLTFGNTNNIKMFEFFFLWNTPFSILLVATIPTIFSKKNILSQLLFSLTLLLCLLLVLPSKFQVLRGVLFILPIFYTLSVYVLFKLELKRIYKIIVIIIFGIYTILNYPPNFTKGPYIPGEIIYRDYKLAYTYLETNCSTKEILGVTHRPNISSLYNVKTNYTTYAKTNFLGKDIRYIKNTSNQYRTVLGDIPVLNTRQVKEYLRNNNVCIITFNTRQETTRYLDHFTYDFIKENYNEIIFNGLTIYAKN